MTDYRLPAECECGLNPGHGKQVLPVYVCECSAGQPGVKPRETERVKCPRCDDKTDAITTHGSRRFNRWLCQTCGYWFTNEEDQKRHDEETCKYCGASEGLVCPTCLEMNKPALLEDLRDRVEALERQLAGPEAQPEGIGSGKWKDAVKVSSQAPGYFPGGVTNVVVDGVHKRAQECLAIIEANGCLVDGPHEMSNETVERFVKWTVRVKWLEPHYYYGRTSLEAIEKALEDQLWLKHLPPCPVCGKDPDDGYPFNVEETIFHVGCSDYDEGCNHHPMSPGDWREYAIGVCMNCGQRPTMRNNALIVHDCPKLSGSPLVRFGIRTWQKGIDPYSGTSKEDYRIGRRKGPAFGDGIVIDDPLSDEPVDPEKVREHYEAVRPHFEVSDYDRADLSGLEIRLKEVTDQISDKLGSPINVIVRLAGNVIRRQPPCPKCKSKETERSVFPWDGKFFCLSCRHHFR